MTTREVLAVRVVFRVLVFVWSFAGLCAPAVHAASALVSAPPPAPEAASALAPYAMWVGRLPSDDPATWDERKRLVHLRGRLGAWLEADYQVRALRATPVRHAELCVLLTRAARANEDWERAAKWFAAARESLNRIPAGERAVALVTDFYDEAIALREVADVRPAYAALTPFLEDDTPREETFGMFARLTTMALVAGDEENYTKLASSLLTTARAWHREVPAPDRETSAADRALGSFLDELILRGYAATATQLIEPGIADPALRETLVRAAEIAVLARERDEMIAASLAKQPTLHHADAALFGPDDQRAGLAVWLVRLDRTALALDLLAAARDRQFAEREGAARAAHERAWNSAVRRTAEACWQAGRAGSAADLEQLYLEATAATMDAAAPSLRIDVREGLVEFARWLGEHGRTAEAQRLLDSLPGDYPDPENPVDASHAYHAMHPLAAATVLQQKHAALAFAWAAAGEVERANESVRQLPSEDIAGLVHWSAVRRNIRGAIATAAALAGEGELANRLVDELRESRDHQSRASSDEVTALTPALILTGRHEEAWEDLGHVRDVETVIADVIPALIARQRINRVIEWIGFAPEPQRRAAWRAFFDATVPKPDRLPVRSGK